MREYTSPLIDDMDVSVEGVYAGSGSSPDIPDIPIIPPRMIRHHPEETIQ